MKRSHNKRTQKGFSLVVVIFVITVLAVAVVFIQRISNVAVATNNLSMQGARAWQAAQAGAEWGIYQATNGNCAVSTTLNLTELSLNGFQVTVGCNSETYTEAMTTITIYTLDVLAEYGILGTTPDYVSRKISVTAEG